MYDIFAFLILYDVQFSNNFKLSKPVVSSLGDILILKVNTTDVLT